MGVAVVLPVAAAHPVPAWQHASAARTPANGTEMPKPDRGIEEKWSHNNKKYIHRQVRAAPVPHFEARADRTCAFLV